MIDNLLKLYSIQLMEINAMKIESEKQYFINPLRDANNSETCKCGTRYESIYSAYHQECRRCEMLREGEYYDSGY